MRIVSLLPSATEIVCALGLADDLVAVSHECDWPPEAVGKPAVTRGRHNLQGIGQHAIHDVVSASVHGGSGLYELDEGALAEARPDLIITQELCAACAVSYREVNEVARRLEGAVTVVSLEPTSIEGILHTISTVGAMADAEDAAIELIESLRVRLSDIEARVQARREDGHRAVRSVALEWLDPPFAVGHWVPEQIRRAGGWDLLGRDGERSVETTWAAVREVDPDSILLMPCGLDVRDTVREWSRIEPPPLWSSIEAARRGQVFAVDGSAYFSRPGPRVIDGIAILAEIFDPDEFVEMSPPGSWTPIL
ncbi:MAG TPA: cobalamin-binding protein [Candidatus Limnocylindrales bacterium]